MTPTTGHGGKREGAGRKPINPEGPTINIGATVPESLMERLDARADKARVEPLRGRHGGHPWASGKRWTPKAEIGGYDPIRERTDPSGSV